MRSTKDSWLTGPGDLREAEVQDVPIPGQSVKVRALSAKYSAEVQSQVRMVNEGRSQVAKIDVPAMEILQFVHGVIDPVFTIDEARVIQERMGPAWRKVIAKIDELSGIDKEAIEQTEQRFPAGGTSQNGTEGRTAAEPVVDAAAAGDNGPDVPARTG